MIKIISILATASLISSAFGKEFQINEEKFEQKVSLTGIAKPIGATEVSIAPKVWGDFVIEKIIPHGTLVKKGERIVWIDTEKCDVYLNEQIKERELDALKLESAKKELEELKVSTERSLRNAKINFDREAADYAYYTEVSHPESIASSKLSGEVSKWNLANVEEELKQLLKMYAEDGLTEETEEIIITRHKNSVTHRRFTNKKAQEAMKHELEVELPRQLADRKRQHEKAAITYDYQKRVLNKALQEKEISVAKLVMAEAQKAKKLAECKADRAAMEITAPHDGYVYYGSFEQNFWKKDIATKYLHEGSKLPSHKPFMTIVPAAADLVISASADSAVTRNIEVGSVGQLRINASPWQRFESKVTALSEVPNMQGSWSVELSSDLPKGSALKAGEGVLVSFTTYQKEQAISVPVAALTEEADGSFSVQVKMADGETQATAVTLGKSSASMVEVLSGLSAGQVITYGDE